MDLRFQLDLDFERTIAETRREFRAIDPLDRDQLRAWFLDHQHLTDRELAIIVGVRRWSLRRLLFALGIRSRRNKRKPPCTTKRRSLPVVPPNWNDAWLAEQYQSGYGTRLLAAATGLRVDKVRIRLLRTLEKLRDPATACRSKHRCCTREWVFKHYIVDGLTITACARLAGVPRSTFGDWLERFGFRVRATSEYLAHDMGEATSTTTTSKSASH